VHLLQIIQNRTHPLLREIGLILFSVLTIAFLGKISILTPLSPIPFALRPILVIALAWTFGTRVTLSALTLFCLGVEANIPFLVTTAAVSKTLFGATFGYIFGYFAVAVIAPEMRKRGMRLVISFILLSTIIDLLGACGLSCLLGLKQGFTLGFFPFLLSDCLKAVVFAKGYQFLFAGR